MDFIASLTDLSSAYDECERAARALLDGVPSADASEREDMDARNRSVVAKFIKVDQGVRRLQVISKNDDADDIETEHLKYLLVNYYLCALSTKSAAVRSPQARYDAIRKGLDYGHAFLNACDNIGLLKEGDRKVWKSLSEKEQMKRDDVRNARIERYKREKIAKSILETLRSRTGDSKDEDTERRCRLLVNEMCLCNVLDTMATTQQEIEILEHMIKVQSQPSRAPPSASSSSSQPRRPPPKAATEGLVLTHIGADGQMRREILKSQVFRPSHRLPTMSIEEFGELEVQRMKEAKARKAKEGSKAPDKRIRQLEEAGLEDEIDLVDKATVRDRAWDTWKDEHTKGAGVTKRF